MLLSRFPSLPLILTLFLVEVITQDAHRDLPLVHLGDLDERGETPRDWFRVRRQEESPRESHISNGNFDFGDQPEESLTSASFDDGNVNDDNVQHEEAGDNFASPSVRNRRLYYEAPVYTGEVRPLYSDGNTGTVDKNGRCKCDMEYVLKYRNNPVYYARSGGAFRVKVVHEEIGRFESGNSNDEAIPIRRPSPSGGWPGRYIPDERPKYVYSGGGGGQQRPQQRPSNAEYYVEEIDDSGNRRGDGIFGRRTGPVGDKALPGNFKSQRTIRSKLSSSRKLARIARALVKASRFGTLTVMSSTESAFGGYPYSQACRFSDGTSSRNSSGIPYIFLTPAILDASYLGSDMEISAASLTISPYEQCESDTEGQDEEPWKCANVILSGRIIPVTSTWELNLAADSLGSRHSQRHFQGEGYFARMILNNVVVQQNPISGGAQSVLVNDYLN